MAYIYDAQKKFLGRKIRNFSEYFKRYEELDIMKNKILFIPYQYESPIHFMLVWFTCTNKNCTSNFLCLKIKVNKTISF